MNRIQDADFYSTFPPALKQDEKMAVLGRIIADELHTTVEQIQKNIIYANIENLSETWLDTLAYDLHVDWYDYDYPVAAKRAIIRDSVRVHQKLGTKAAVEMALGGIHPKSEIEEWFEYGGSPYRFRIVLDTTESRVAADYDEIVKTVDIYKRLTAHLDGLYYQGSVVLSVLAQTEYYLFQAPMTGQIKTGTEPRENTVGAATAPVIDVLARAAGYRADYTPAGTKPRANIMFSMEDAVIVSESDTAPYCYANRYTGTLKTGTEPNRNIEGSAEKKGLAAVIKSEKYEYQIKRCGSRSKL